MGIEDGPKFNHGIEKRENEPRFNSIQFDNSHFGETEKSMGTEQIVEKLNEWWEKICSENKVDPDDKKFKNIDYFIMELGKNALEHANGGEIKVLFENDKITVIVTDHGQGFENPNDDILYGAPGHGLSEVKHYEDEFIIETNSKKFTKVPKKKKLVSSEDTDIQNGTRIIFIKKFELSK